MLDLTPKQQKIILNIFDSFLPGCELRVFGSRYKGTAKKHSDLDIAVFCDTKPDWVVIEKIKEAFQESELPFRVDVLDWHSISAEFRKVIEAGYEVLQRE